MKVAIVSLRFAPGHIAHLLAYEKLFIENECDVKLFLDSKYKDFISTRTVAKYIDSINDLIVWKPDILLSYNISGKNIKLTSLCKKNNIKMYYVLHEPWDSLGELLSQRERIPRRILANIVNYLTCINSHKVILASKIGESKYKKYMYSCNKNYAVFPLIFLDEYDQTKSIDRKYFSFIGGFTETRGCIAFLHFVEQSYKLKRNIRFMIATRSNISHSSYLNNDILQKAIKERILIVHDGKPMSSEEINNYYRQSLCVWNAYNNSTQSGVLANALMQGTPVIVGDKGVSKAIIKDRREGCFISLPHKDNEILDSYKYILGNGSNMSMYARECFLKEYYYRSWIGNN